MSILIVLLSARSGFSEARGKTLEYSKFGKSASKLTSKRSTRKMVPSRLGFLTVYIPTFLASVASLLLYRDGNSRFLLVTSAFSLMFLKRIMEVLFIHKYSGQMAAKSLLQMFLGYFVSTITVIYTQKLNQGFPEPKIDLKYPGALLFLVGISGNFYHNYLLSQQRETKDDKEYKTPRGGLFCLVACPHYLFDIITLLAISFITQTVFAFCLNVGSTMYLMGRARATRNWYRCKFGNFPGDVRAVFPYVF